MSGKYDDIISLSRPVSKKHPPMDREMRAAQFSAFAALVGYDDLVKETARRTEKKPELDEDQKVMLNEKIVMLLEDDRCAEFVYFVPDGKKAGGQLLTVSGQIKKVDEYTGKLILSDGTEFPIEDLCEINV